MGKQKRTGRVWVASKQVVQAGSVEAFEQWLRGQEGGLLFAGYLSVGRIWIGLDNGETVTRDACQNALEAAEYFRDLAGQQGFPAAWEFLETTAAAFRRVLGGGSWR